MKVLILGSGARVHSTIWKLCQSEKHPIHIVLAPANFDIIQDLRARGTEKTIECLDANIYDVARLAEIAMVRGIDLTIPCEPELYELGIVDKFRELGLQIFGPKKAAAHIASSQFFARELMYEADIPAPKYAAFDNIYMAKAFLPSVKLPAVLRVDNPINCETPMLIATTASEAEAFVEEYFSSAEPKNKRIIIEEYIEGPVYTVATICDGEVALSLPTVQSYRELNTDLGGYAPAPELNDDVMFAIRKQIINPCIEALKHKQIPYTGMLAFDVVLRNLETSTSPEGEGSVITATRLNNLDIRLVQLRCSLSDTDSNVIMPLLDEDLYDVLSASSRGNLSYFTDGFHRYPGSALNINLLPGEQESTGIVEEDAELKIKIQNSIKEMSASLNAAALIFEGLSNSRAKSRKLSAEHKLGKKILSTTAVAENLIDAQILAYKMAETASSYSAIEYKRDIGDQGML